MWYFQKEFFNLSSVSIFSFFMILQDSIRVQSQSQKRCTVNKFGRWCGEIWCDFNMFPATSFASVEKLWPSIESNQYTCSPKKKESRHLKIKNLSNFFAMQAKSVFRLHKLQTVFKTSVLISGTSISNRFSESSWKVVRAFLKSVTRVSKESDCGFLTSVMRF